MTVAVARAAPNDPAAIPSFYSGGLAEHIVTDGVKMTFSDPTPRLKTWNLHLAKAWGPHFESTQRREYSSFGIQMCPFGAIKTFKFQSENPNPSPLRILAISFLLPPEGLPRRGIIFQLGLSAL